MPPTEMRYGSAKIIFSSATTALLVLMVQSGLSQTSDSTVFNLDGYIKDMQILSFENNLDDMVNDNLLHNRINLHLYPAKALEAGLGLRTRMFTGESVEKSVAYSDAVDVDNGIVDASILLVDENALILLTQIDRCWVDWHSDKFAVRAGRQRINWGVNMFWNSNDLFNAYDLIDFDYEERPGSDALRIQHFSKGMITQELAFSASTDSLQWIGAFKYGFNKWQYDFQLIAARWYDDVAVGAGWAGNIGTAGFKGEATYFHPQDNWQDSSGVLSASLSADFIFGNQIMVTTGALYVSEGVEDKGNTPLNLYSANLDAKHLMPTKYNALLNVMAPVTPILNAGAVLIYAPGVDLLFAMPSITGTLSDNWELALFGQMVWMDTGNFNNLGNGVFIRIKGSF